MIHSLALFFLEKFYWISYFFFGSALLKQKIQVVASVAQKFPPKKNSLEQTKILEQGKCEFDKTQGGAGFSVTRIVLESVTEI